MQPESAGFCTRALIAPMCHLPEWNVASPALRAASAMVNSERGSALVSAVQMQSRLEWRPVRKAPREGEQTFIA